MKTGKQEPVELIEFPLSYLEVYEAVASTIKKKYPHANTEEVTHQWMLKLWSSRPTHDDILNDFIFAALKYESPEEERLTPLHVAMARDAYFDHPAHTMPTNELQEVSAEKQYQRIFKTLKRRSPELFSFAEENPELVLFLCLMNSDDLIIRMIAYLKSETDVFQRIQKVIAQILKNSPDLQQAVKESVSHENTARLTEEMISNLKKLRKTFDQKQSNRQGQGI